LPYGPFSHGAYVPGCLEQGILHIPNIGLPNKMQYSQSLYNLYEDSEVDNEAKEA
jgi:hypothetical protein